MKDAIVTDLTTFVIMPFDEFNTEIYSHVVRPAVEASGFRCRRSDDSVDATSITSDIIQAINVSDVIIAELTGRNPNVFYELALAHAFRRPTVMICRELSDIPFDLLTYRVISYDMSPKGLKLLENQIRGVLDAYTHGSGQFRNPVIDHMSDSPFAAVVRSKEVLQFEGRAKERVCVLAPDIALGPSMFRSVMRSNIERGVRYQYLLPNEPELIQQFEEFAESLDLGDKRGLLGARVTDKDFIESDVTLVDPGTPNENGFILAPAEKADYHYHLAGGALFRIKERFSRLWFRAEELH